MSTLLEQLLPLASRRECEQADAAYRKVQAIAPRRPLTNGNLAPWIKANAHRGADWLLAECLTMAAELRRYSGDDAADLTRDNSVRVLRLPIPDGPTVPVGYSDDENGGLWGVYLSGEWCGVDDIAAGLVDEWTAAFEVAQ